MTVSNEWMSLTRAFKVPSLTAFSTFIKTASPLPDLGSKRGVAILGRFLVRDEGSVDDLLCDKDVVIGRFPMCIDEGGECLFDPLQYPGPLFFRKECIGDIGIISIDGEGIAIGLPDLECRRIDWDFEDFVIEEVFKPAHVFL